MAKNSIELTRGDSLDLHIDLKDEDGEAYTLKEGDELTLTVKRSASSSEALITKHGQDISILPEDTSALEFGVYRYDVQLTTLDGRVCTVIKPSDFVVAEEVTW